MMAAGLVRVPVTAFVTGIAKPSILLRPTRTNICTRFQLYANESRLGTRRAQRRSLKEMAMSPAGDGGTYLNNYLYQIIDTGYCNTYILYIRRHVYNKSHYSVNELYILRCILLLCCLSVSLDICV